MSGRECQITSVGRGGCGILTKVVMCDTMVGEGRFLFRLRVSISGFLLRGGLLKRRGKAA